MRHIIYTFALGLILSFKCNSQESKAVEKSIYNLQVGTVGIWFNNEMKLKDNIALRLEVGLFSEIFEGVGYYMAPEVSIEPRYYYNILKRLKKGKDIANNAADFFTLKLNYRSDLFEINNLNGRAADVSYAIIPKWGIRRNLGSKFNYELGLGIGYFDFIKTRNPVSEFDDGLHVELHLRIGLNL